MLTFLAALLLSTQTPPVTPAQAAMAQQPETAVPDITVEGRPLQEATADFVRRIVRTPRDSGAAVWSRGVCIAVANLRRETAEEISGRISTIAESVGVEVRGPGCEPRVFIVFAADADEAAARIADTQIRRFRTNLSGSDLGDAALRAFRTSDRPIRWWQVSAKVDPDTGQITERQPGQQPFQTNANITLRASPNDFGSFATINEGSLLRDPLRDDLAQVIVVVDIDQIADLSINQLSGYLAMVSLAQIDPDLDAGPYDSILGVFAGPGGAQGVTDWDIAYLEGLYSAEQSQADSNARLGAVADAMASQLRRNGPRSEATSAAH